MGRIHMLQEGHSTSVREPTNRTLTYLCDTAQGQIEVAQHECNIVLRGFEISHSEGGNVVLAAASALDLLPLVA